MNGVLVVDKPAGMTSHDVVAVVRRALRGQPGSTAAKSAPKVGHAGTLDPDATGVLVVAVGKATKLIRYLQASTKTYDARIRFGTTTTTLDAAGEVVTERDAAGLTERTVADALTAFVGDIQQVPPMVSAVKVGGERLYRKARRGEEVEREPRRVHVHDLVLTDFTPGTDAAGWPEASIVVTCSAGTYVRTLAADLGERVGTGAHVRSLRRLASGPFDIADAVPLEEAVSLAEAGGLADVVLSMSEAVADYPSVRLDQVQLDDISHGRPLPATGYDGPVAALAPDGRLAAMVTDADGRARPQTVVVSPDG